MNRPEGIPLTLGEAKLAVKQPMDPYHAWVIEELIKRVEKCEKQKQKLVDINFETVLTALSEEFDQGKTTDEAAAWVARQLDLCGFKTTPMGASWGVLEKE